MFAPGYWGTGERYWQGRYWPPFADEGQPVPRKPGGGVEAHWDEYRRGVQRPWDWAWRDRKVEAELKPIYELIDRAEEIVEEETGKAKTTALATLAREASSIAKELSRARLPELLHVQALAKKVSDVVRRRKVDKAAVEALRAAAERIEHRRRNNQRAVVALLMSY